jgi:peptidoglycan/xylan/chitin deacetylase (PgdA/CDA1 family)
MKAALKRIVYSGLFYSGGLALSMKIASLLRKDRSCIILAYHRFVDDRSVYLSKGPVMHHQIREFEKEIAYLTKHYVILSIDEAVSKIKSRQGFARPAVVLTFDDGYLDNYTLAYPILKKYNVPATIYLTTGLIGTSERTWPDRIELALMETSVRQFAHPDLFGGSRIPIATKVEKEKVCLDIGQTLKPMPCDRRLQILEEVLMSLGMNGKGEGMPRMMLNWEEVKEMAANGITFGSHSHTHPILSKMPVEAAKGEIFISKQMLEERLGKEVKHFAIPNGGKDDFSEELRDYCRRIGFESIVSLIHGVNNGSQGDVFDLRRIGATSPLWALAANLIRQQMKSRQP